MPVRMAQTTGRRAFRVKPLVASQRCACSCSPGTGSRCSTSTGSSTAIRRATGLSAQGGEEATALAPADRRACRSTSASSRGFPRAQETARIALADTRAARVPRRVDPDLDDIRLGELEGRTLEDYRAWKHGRTRDEPFPGGESLNDAARRYADAYRAHPRAATRRRCSASATRSPCATRSTWRPARTSSTARCTTCGNATPYVFDAAGLRRAVERLRACSR